MVDQGRLSISSFPSIFNIWNSSVRTICLFPHLFTYLIIYLHYHVMDFCIIIRVITQYSLYFVPVLAVRSLDVFDMPLFWGGGISLMSGISRSSRIILYFLDPRINNFSKEPGFLLSMNGIWKQKIWAQLHLWLLACRCFGALSLHRTT